MGRPEFMGYNSQAEMEQAIDREMAKTLMHTSTGRDLERAHQHSPRKQQAEAQLKLRGEPGSMERLGQVMEHVQDPTLIADLAWESVGNHLQNVLHEIRAYEESDYFDGQYPPGIADSFASAARMIASTGDPNLAAAFANELEQSGSMLSGLLPEALQYAEREGQLQDYDMARAHQEAQQEARHERLQKDYADIQRRTGQTGVEAAHQLLTNVGTDVVYDTNLDEDAMRAAARATAEAAAATQRGIDTMGFLQEFDKEVARSHGPGSSWNDAEREKWEAEQRASTVEVVERKFGTPEQHDHKAVLGMLLDDRKAETGKGIFEEQLDHELAKHNSHARQNSPHLKALNEANVADYESSHDTDGFKRVGTDGRGNETGLRYTQR